MSNLYNTLCVVRTSMLNVIGQMYLDGKPKNLVSLLKSIGEEITDHVDFVEEFLEMTEDELLDLGFDYLNEHDDFMLIPAWLFPLVPEGVEIIDIDGQVFTLEEPSQVSLYGDSWVNAGLYYPTMDIEVYED